MKYELELRARPNPDESVEVRHRRFAPLALEISRIWLPTVGVIPPAREPGTQPAAHLGLKGKLAIGVTGSISYANRKYLLDEGRFDDTVFLRFNAAKVNFNALVQDAFYQYVVAFDAYQAAIYNVEFTDATLEEACVDVRHTVVRLLPTAFLDRQLCNASFGDGPEQLARRLGEIAGAVEGGLLVRSPCATPFVESLMLSDGLTALLRGPSN